MFESKYEKQSVDRFTFISEENLTLMKNNNIRTLGELAKHSELELRNFGLNNNEIKETKKELNLLGMWLKN
ncbi:MAG: hypothetical protein IKF38_07595 [Clostridia bacterium]|nr:hypothetical protein [Clostridia bacterium]